MKLLAFVLVAVLLPACRKSAAPPFHLQQDLGVAAVKADGTCLDILNGSLPLGQRFQLVSASQPPVIAKAEISAKSGQPCTPGDQNADWSHYQFKVVSGSLPKAVPAFALVNFDNPIATSDAGATADLNSNGHASTFRFCTSTEGIHLTVWDGKPLESRRAWHSYYYLGYDVDPTCTNADTKPDAP